MDTRQKNPSKYPIFRVPAKLLVLSLAVLLVTTACAPTTTLVLRHVEKAPGGSNTPLSPQGQIRAQELIHVLGEAGVTVIYATQFIRTQQTAQLLADHLGLDVNVFNVTGDPQQYADDLADHILSEHRGQVVLIVSHSHTVPLIVEALGASPIPPITGDEYDKLLIVTVPRGRGNTKIVKAEYGSRGSGLSTQRRTSMSNKTIKEVKEAWEERLMAMPGVMGVGIGLTKDTRQKCIKVYVERKASAQAAQIPREIEGYPVEVEIRGTFRPR